MFDFLMGYVLGERAASRAAAFSRDAGAAAGGAGAGELYDLNLRMDRMLLAVDAMWSLMRDSGLSDDDLAERIRMLDEADGVADGRRTPQPIRCTSCDSMIAPGRATCTFCGADAPETPGPLEGL